MATVKQHQGQVFPSWATHTGMYKHHTFWIGDRGYLLITNDHGTNGSMIDFSDDRAIQPSEFHSVTQK